MCAQYQVEAEVKRLAAQFKRPFEGKMEWKPRVVPYALAPVIVGDHLQLMQFSLVPSWSKEPKVKFPTYNARLDTILEKPTWKSPFVKKHCIVPMSAFVEPVYVSKKGLAGNMVAFHQRGEELLLAAGIWDEWKDKQTGKTVQSFAIVTDEPSDYVKDVGHDRQPVFLGRQRAEEWLANVNDKGEDLRTFLKEVAEEPDFATAIDRPMVKGWEKRIPKD